MFVPLTPFLPYTNLSVVSLSLPRLDWIHPQSNKYINKNIRLDVNKHPSDHKVNEMPACFLHTFPHLDIAKALSPTNQMSLHKHTLSKTLFLLFLLVNLHPKSLDQYTMFSLLILPRILLPAILHSSRYNLSYSSSFTFSYFL